MSVLIAAFLGLIQGITEFFPVSSSGHLSIFQKIFDLNYNPSEHLFFDVLLHFGTLIAVFLVYRNELMAMATETIDTITGRRPEEENDGRLRPGVRNLLLIAIATLPLAVIIPFHNEIERLYSNTGFIAFALIITGLLLLVSDMFGQGKKTEKTATLLDALLVGVAQAIATIPGLSRSGATITTGLAMGYKRSYAIRFSFLMSIPAVLGSVVVTLISAIRDGIDWSYLPAYLVGMVIAGLVGYFALVFMKQYMSKKPFTYFAAYCFVAGIAAIIVTVIS